MSEKKPFSDKRWTQPLKPIDIGYSEVTEEEKKRAEEALIEILLENKMISSREEYYRVCEDVEDPAEHFKKHKDRFNLKDRE